MTTDDVSGFDVPPPTPAGSSDQREALIRILHGCILSIDETKAAQAADLCLAVGFTRAYNDRIANLIRERDGLSETLAQVERARRAAVRERDEAIACADAAGAKLANDMELAKAAGPEAVEAIRCLNIAIDVQFVAVTALAFGIKHDAVNSDHMGKVGERIEDLIAAEQRAARLADILRYVRSDLVCSCMDDSCTVCSIDRALAGNAATDGEGWIACSERMPAERIDVEIKGPDGVEVGQWREHRQCMLGPRAGECGAGFVSREADDLPVYDVTHWRPLPAPPAANAATKETNDVR